MNLLRNVLYIFFLMVFSNCTAWPSLVALVFSPSSKGGSCIVCLLGIGGGNSPTANANSTPPTSTPTNTNPVTTTPTANPASNVNGDDYAISPATQTIQVGGTQFFVLNKISNNTTIDSGVTWTTSASSIATIASNGLVTGIAASATPVTITAKFSGIEKTATLTVNGDTTPPVVDSVSSVTSTSVRVVFSKEMNSQASVAGNYRITTVPTGTCSSNSNFTTSASALAVSAVTKIANNTYDLTIAAQTTGTLYTLLVNKALVQDVAAPANALGCPNNSDFIGNEVLKVTSVSCSSTSNIIVTYSKPVKTGVDLSGSAECSSNAECIKRYKINGSASLGDISSARVLDGTVCGGLAANSSKVCLTTSLLQNGSIFSLVVANNLNGDGFDNLAFGAIRNSADTENLQAQPRDRGSFLGCGVPLVNFADGPIVVDPFTDGSDFGYLTLYSNKVHIGPNKNGNSVTRFNADGSNPGLVTFSFGKDTTGDTTPANATLANGRTSRNTAAAPFYTIGKSGCTSNSNDPNAGCGPDNQDGRGFISSGTVNGTEYMFLSGYHSAGDNDYLYFSSDQDSNFNFNYLDNSYIFNSCAALAPGTSKNIGTDSIHIFNDRIFWGMPGDGQYRPYGIKINTALAGNTDVACDGTYTETQFLNFQWGQGFGNWYNYTATRVSATASADPLRASPDMIGGVFQNFNSRLYFANSGSISYNNTGVGVQCVSGSTYSAGACEQTGGLARSINNNPKACAEANNCPEWVNISPSDSKYKQFFSIGLPTSGVTTSPIPAQKPIPSIASFNSNLYAIRNACRTVLWTETNPVSCLFDAVCSNDPYCASGDERPQLWKCNPATTGSATECDSGDWSLVADNGAGFTNFGDTNNKQITMLQANGTYLYLGFDNPNGIKVYRTNIANPVSSNDFSQIGGDGFGNTTTNRQIFSTLSIQNGSIYFVYASIGQNAVPVRVHRQQNN